jgi:hypothetical protein
MFVDSREKSTFVKDIAKTLVDYNWSIRAYPNAEDLIYAAYVLGKWYLIDKICENNRGDNFDGFYCLRQYDTWWPTELDTKTLDILLKQASYDPRIPFALVKNLETTLLEDPDWIWNFPLAGSMMTDCFMLNQAAVDKLAGNFFNNALYELDVMYNYFGKRHRCLTDMPGTILSNILTKSDIIVINTRAITIPEVNHNWVAPTSWDRLSRLNTNLSE